MRQVKDLTGQRFGRLLVLKLVERPTNIKNGTYFLCKCDCGKEKIIWSSSLIEGHTISCGCLRQENFEKRKIGEFQSAINRLYRNYKRRAIKRGLSFLLTRNEFVSITNKNCYYCGQIPNQVCKSEFNTGDYIYNGVDRVDNNKGYEFDNCVPCCGQCNRSKTDFTSDQFYKWIDKIIETRKEREK